MDCVDSCTTWPSWNVQRAITVAAEALPVVWTDVYTVSAGLKLSVLSVTRELAAALPISISVTATVLAAGVVAVAAGVTSPDDSFFSFEQALAVASAITATISPRVQRA